ncbi:MAG: hypothetical protein OSJ73_18185 [Lachnospiraceae bacterium]|nr:hypothetical protein [Lachnospiraceae bacterium]
MMVDSNMTPEKFDQVYYEYEKENLIKLYKENNWDMEQIGMALINNLCTNMGEKVICWVREDGYTIDESEIWYFFVGKHVIPKRSAPEWVQDGYCREYAMERDELLELQKQYDIGNI